MPTSTTPRLLATSRALAVAAVVLLVAPIALAALAGLVVVAAGAASSPGWLDVLESVLLRCSPLAAVGAVGVRLVATRGGDRPVRVANRWAVVGAVLVVGATAALALEPPTAVPLVELGVLVAGLLVVVLAVLQRPAPAAPAAEPASV
ncbi:hypothetical protein [Nocardioides sp. GY 10127]|uniref:hypothetical protein n=1 Tax=Nocardioides sp. GY 10127 TaxID=2569762 RepID=UPI0010A8B11E|nr:hypothetical protein [Nocardioides sp. GY 10127]TIC79129.1 hypothetical protein E8D37_18395 [Nocardioides sp. GY 10127]